MYVYIVQVHSKYKIFLGLNISSSSSNKTYDATPKFEADDFELKTDECLRTSLNTSIENESENIDDEDLNSEINDIRNTEKYISNDDYNKDGDVCSNDEDNHLSLS